MSSHDKVIEELSEMANLPKSALDKIIRTYLNRMSDALVDDGHVRLPEFVSLFIRVAKETQGHDFKGHRIVIPQRNYVKVSASRNLLDRIN